MSTNFFTPLQSWGITVLRVVVGSVFLMHGGQKLFVWGFAGVATFLGQLGLPAPMLAHCCHARRIPGQPGLFLGMFTRWVANLLAIDMVVAILSVHLPNGFFLPKGFEYPLTLLAANVALVLLGSGKMSVDSFLKKQRARQERTA